MVRVVRTAEKQKAQQSLTAWGRECVLYWFSLGCMILHKVVGVLQ